jgi:Tol biopolymer transport system component
MSAPARAVFAVRPPEERLDSWKEIAAYLGRGTRTVQRWEREENLPVHRLAHQKQSSVYAFKSELDAWWNDRKVRLTDAPGSEAAAAAAPAARRWSAVWMWGLLAGAAVLIAAAGLWWSRHSPAPQSGWKVAPLTAYPGYEGWPSFSPDGKQVAFAWSGPDDKAWDIYVKPVGGDQPRALVRSPQRKYSPVWSPDGSRIAFIRDLGGTRSEIMLVPAGGGPAAHAAEIRNEWVGWFDGLLAWSADSRILIAIDKSNAEAPSSLVAIPVAGGGRRRLTAPPALFLGDSSPAVSPGGETLAFVRCSTLQVCDIYLASLASGSLSAGESRRLTEEKGAVLSPMWTADGREILYTKREGTEVGLWRVPAAGGRSRKISSIGNLGAHAAISRDGGRLAWVQGQADEDIYRAGVAELAAGNAKPVKVAASTRREFDAEISPDGRLLTFISERSGSREVWRSDSSGGNPIQLTSFGNALVSTPRWSPDGKAIAFDVRAHANGDIYVVGSGGGSPRPITAEPSDDAFPAWSANGKWLYFASDRDGASQIWKQPVAGGSAVRLTREGGIAPSESPDGRHVYYMKIQSGDKYALWRVPAGGGEEEFFAPQLGLQKFALTDRGAYFIQGDWNGSDLILAFQPFSSRKPEIAGRFHQRLDTGLSLFPAANPKWLYYTGYEKPTADLMMAELES